MRVLVQRVSRASVTVGTEVVGAIGQGMLTLVGITGSDTPAIAEQMARKCVNLRVFDDERGVMNRSIADFLAAGQDASVLAVSQFTLYADTRKGRRPSYVDAAPPGVALPLFEHFVTTLETLGIPVQTGRFGAEMAVEMVNDGPVTIWLDSDILRRGV
jgi:D-tyrosyl-tRNA(Tyr) deacylase